MNRHLEEMIKVLVPIMELIPIESPGRSVHEMFENVVFKAISYISKVGDYNRLMITLKVKDIRIKIEEFRVRINDVMNAANLALAVTSDRAPLILKPFSDEDLRQDDEDAKRKLKSNSVEAISTGKNMSNKSQTFLTR
ncbi:PREDICTED: uncharacterized protein LOC106805327 [Priapulus caudatus]|uniref:Uncharacterized protein LOC106805327 n=1 Tax=Priapulus caudatus TaxID=37621 RepID=A0ABM1DQZ3_PRICU|nr:PREDICTED: uncharacterized protein LOC106805327 [Priapulus caudatus]